MSNDKNKITKVKMYFDLDKELAYINEMNEKGWKLVYIKAGMLYTFTKCQPGEYVTVLHSGKKENISQIQAFAAQCGYESIPHTLDGFGDTLYLTGRKEDVSDDFVTDKDSQIDSFQILHKKFKILEIVYTILFAGISIEFGFFLYLNDLIGGELIGMNIFLGVFDFIILLMTIKVFLITHNYKKKINALKSEKIIFE